MRWHQSVKLLDVKLEGIVGDTLVGAAAVAYLGAFTAHYRTDLLNIWVNMCKDADIPVTKDFDLIRSMVDMNQVRREFKVSALERQHSLACKKHLYKIFSSCIMTYTLNY